MQKKFAEELAQRLRGRRVSSWTLGEYIGHGGSAFVVKGEGNPPVAIKIFDPELVDRFGDDIEEKRIKRELALRGKSHPNLVAILDGGRIDDFHYIVMRFVEGTVLSALLERFPRNRIRKVINQIASAAHYLEESGYVHRDIKPANIVVSNDFDTATLLDFGVVRSMWDDEITESHAFLGTKRYAPPEFLFRTAGDGVEDWRAVTFYQLGAVLHDLIMRAGLFAEYKNEAQVVDAVKNIKPRLVAADVEPQLLALTMNCLLKDPQLRLRFVNWHMLLNESSAPTAEVDALKTKIVARRVAAVSDNAMRSTEQLVRLRHQIEHDVVQRVIGAIRQISIESGDFPPLEVKQDGTLPPTVRATYSSSTSHAVPRTFGVEIRIEVVDPIAQAVLVSAQPIAASEDELNAWREIFAGAYEPSIVHANIEKLLYESLAEAQEQ